jgi:hypothetical protein
MKPTYKTIYTLIIAEKLHGLLLEQLDYHVWARISGRLRDEIDNPSRGQIEQIIIKLKLQSK